MIDDIYVSTDCQEYENIALNAQAKSLGLRSKDLATDTANSIDVAIDLIQRLKTKYDYLILLQPTSPIREPKDIDTMLTLLQDNSADACVSISPLEEPHPYKLKSINEFGYVSPFIDGKTSEIPRQLLPKVYALNGAIYITRIKTILEEKTFLPKKTLPYVMDHTINIDTEEDFLLLDALYKKNKVKIWGINV